MSLQEACVNVIRYETVVGLELLLITKTTL